MNFDVPCSNPSMFKTILNVLLYPMYTTLYFVQSVAVTFLYSSLYILLQLVTIITNLNTNKQTFRTLIQSTMVFKLISHVVGIVRNVLSKDVTRSVTRSRTTMLYSDDCAQLAKEKIQWKSRALLIKAHEKLDDVHLQT